MGLAFQRDQGAVFEANPFARTRNCLLMFFRVMPTISLISCGVG
jgi:hypothetical protein